MLEVVELPGHASSERDESSASRFPAIVLRTLAVVALAALATLPAWSFGGVLPWTQVWLAAVVALVSVAAPIAVAFRFERRPPSLILAGFLFAVAWPAFQLVPLPGAWLQRLSPRSVELREELGTPVSDAQRGTLSLNPASTRRDLALALLAVGAFVAGAVFFARPRTVILLCTAVAASGALLAFFEIAQLLQHGPLWRSLWTDSGGFLGPFINRNHSGAYFNLALGAVLALLVWNVRRRLQRPGGVEIQILTVAAAAVLIVGLCCTLSRGAALALGIAAAATMVLVGLLRRRELPLRWMAAIALAGVLLLAWVGMRGPVRERMATIASAGATLGGRGEIWHEGLRAAADFLPTGSGLGTYRYIYPPYQQRPDTHWYYHAENHYLELLVDVGIPGLLFVLATLALIFHAIGRGLRHSDSLEGRALAIGALFVLIGQAVHASFDFALYLPANLLLVAVFAGAAIAASSTAARRGTFALVPATLNRPLALALMLLFAVGSGWSLFEFHRRCPVETALRHERPTASPDESATQWQAAMDDFRAGLAGVPDDAEGQYRLAELYAALYQVRVFADLTHSSLAGKPQGQLWQAATPQALHARACELARSGDPRLLHGLPSQAVVRDCLVPAWEHCLRARAACPLLPQPHLGLAQLERLAGPQPVTHSAHLARVRQLAPCNAGLHYQAGLIELHEGHRDAACADWRRALQMGDYQARRLLDQIFLAASPHLTVWQIIDDVVPPSAELLTHLAQVHYASPGDAPARALIARRVALLDPAPHAGSAPEPSRHDRPVGMAARRILN